MNAELLALAAKDDIETIGGISLRVGMQLEALGYDVAVLEDSIKAMIARKKGSK